MLEAQHKAFNSALMILKQLETINASKGLTDSSQKYMQQLQRMLIPQRLKVLQDTLCCINLVQVALGNAGVQTRRMTLVSGPLGDYLPPLPEGAAENELTVLGVDGYAQLKDRVTQHRAEITAEHTRLEGVLAAVSTPDAVSAQNALDFGLIEREIETHLNPTTSGSSSAATGVEG